MSWEMGAGLKNMCLDGGNAFEGGNTLLGF